MTDSKRIDRKDAEVLGTLTATVSMALDGLSDVSASSPSVNDALTWNGSAWVPQAGSGGTPTAITVADESSDTQCYPAFFTAATGDLGPKTDATYLTYNASTGAFGATRFNAAADNQVLTSAADTTVTLDGTYSSDIVVSGTAVMYVLNLGDARTYTNGKRFNVTNGTPEFIGVVNTNGTVWHRVPPRAYCECVLLDNSTASGVWNSRMCENRDPAAGWSAIWDSGTSASGLLHGEAGLTTAVSGTAAAANMVIPATTAVGRQGVHRMYAGTTATGYALGYSSSNGNTSTFFTGGARAFQASVGFMAISTAADEYIGRVGFGDNIAGGAHTEGFYFLYDRAELGTTWRIKGIQTAGGAANTVVDTTIAPLYSSTYDSYQRLRGEVSSAGTRGDAWIGTTQVTAAGGITTIPRAAGGTRAYNIGVTGRAYASAATRAIYEDYHWLQLYPTTLR